MRLIREEKTFIREAVLLMLPMILQNFVTFSMSMADTFMVGVLGETALAAVTMANSPFYVMQLMIFGVQSGMSVLVAQYHGRGDQDVRCRQAVLRAGQDQHALALLDLGSGGNRGGGRAGEGRSRSPVGKSGGGEKTAEQGGSAELEPQAGAGTDALSGESRLRVHRWHPFPPIG